MRKSLVLAEKPSVGRDIARVLQCHKNGNGYFEGNHYVVTWALGHLITLSEPEKYDQRYKEWRLEDLPIIPRQMKLQVIRQTNRQFQIVKQLLLRPDIQEIIIATDAGREGELVARWILDVVHVRKTIKRLWISSVTDRAIREGFQKLKDGKETLPLYYSARARAIADWLVGINATRALTTKYNAQLSCGRVQTPTLALVKMREDEIRQFKPRTYYGLTAEVKGLTFIWQNARKQTNTFQEAEIDRLIARLSGKQATVTNIKRQVKKIPAPQLYDLTELQREANRRFGFSAKKTLNIMQSLYEHHKVLTYPRTDSRYLSKDILPTLKERLLAIREPDNQSIITPLLNKNFQLNKRFVNDERVSDHHAIIPTEERPNFMRFSHDERLIYNLVVNRFLAMLLPEYTIESTTLSIQIDGETFKTRGNKLIELGWKQVETSDEDHQQPLKIPFNEGETLIVTRLIKTSGETKPPAYFTEATLLSAMENPRPYMKTKDKKLLELIGETGGLGTVATRADIIEKLLNTGLIEKRGSSLHTTAKGKQLLELVPDAMKSPELTAKWEAELSKIERKQLDSNRFIKDITEFAIQNVQAIKLSDAKYRHDNMTSKPCPNCGKYLLEEQRKDRKMLVCQDRSCNYKKIISQLTNARCPNCHKRLERYGEGENAHYICVCGFRENQASFQKRMEESKNRVSAREARRLMEKENKKNDAPINTALFDALKNLKIKQ